MNRSPCHAGACHSTEAQAPADGLRMFVARLEATWRAAQDSLDGYPVQELLRAVGSAAQADVTCAWSALGLLRSAVTCWSRDVECQLQNFPDPNTAGLRRVQERLRATLAALHALDAQLAGCDCWPACVTATGQAQISACAIQCVAKAMSSSSSPSANATVAPVPEVAMPRATPGAGEASSTGSRATA